MDLMQLAVDVLGLSSRLPVIRNDLVTAYVASGLDNAAALREASREAKRRISSPKHGRSDNAPSAKDILTRLPLKLL